MLYLFFFFEIPILIQYLSLLLIIYYNTKFVNDTNITLPKLKTVFCQSGPSQFCIKHTY